MITRYFTNDLNVFHSIQRFLDLSAKLGLRSTPNSRAKADACMAKYGGGLTTLTLNHPAEWMVVRGSLLSCRGWSDCWLRWVLHLAFTVALFAGAVGHPSPPPLPLSPPPLSLPAPQLLHLPSQSPIKRGRNAQACECIPLGSRHHYRFTPSLSVPSRHAQYPSTV